MSFRQQGFLASSTSSHHQGALKAQADEFALAHEVNALAMVTLWALEVDTAHKDRAAGALLLMQTLRACQAALLLVGRGLCSEAQNQTRVAVECVIHMATLNRSPAHFEALEAERERHRITHARKILAFEKALEPDHAAKLREVASRKPPAGTSFKYERLADAAGLQALYQVLYRGMSGYASHATLGAIERNVVAVDGVPEMKFGPQHDAVGETLSMIIPMYFEVLGQVATMFKRPELTSEVLRLTATWHALSNKASPPD